MGLYASGDFGCNLLWQSLSLYLLFYYSDVLGVGAAAAGAILLAGAVWDGVADCAVGAWAERMGRPRALVAGAAAPLGLAFVGMYATPRGPGAFAWALAAHLLFRSFYAAVNVPFAALSVRVGRDSRERGAIAALRMVFGAAGALGVGLATAPLLRTAAAAVSDGGGRRLLALGLATAATLSLWLAAAAAPPDGRPCGGREGFGR